MFVGPLRIEERMKERRERREREEKERVLLTTETWVKDKTRSRVLR